MALTNLNTWLQQAQDEQIMQQLYTVINAARSEAIKRGVQVVICPSNNGLSCGKDWSEGYLVFVGHDNKIAPQQEQIIRAYPAIHGKLTWHGWQQSKNYLIFDASGFANRQQGTFKYCNQSQQISSKAMTLIISPNGRARFSNVNDPVYHCSN